jgi:AAA family ATP:ADP antiporter
VSRLHLLVPLTHAACILALLVHPCLATAAIAFGWFKVVDYSVFRAAKEVLYVPLDFDARYRAKMLIDMVIYRTSKGASALALSLASALVQRFMPFLPLVALTAAAAWVPLAAVIGRGFTHAKHP